MGLGQEQNVQNFGMAIAQAFREAPETYSNRGIFTATVLPDQRSSVKPESTSHDIILLNFFEA